MVVRACQKHPDIYSSYPLPATTTPPPTRPRHSRDARQTPFDLAGHPEPPMPDSAITATYRGHVASTQDALIIVEACLRGVLYHTCRRPRASEESSLAKSGNIFVYESRSSGIRNWEDGIVWSTPQRVGNFELCRQLSATSGRSRSNDLGLADIIPRPELYSQGFRAPIDEDDRDEVTLALR
ncbi:Global transcription regulator sge1 [Diaporthe australafricana]|uniref:Global transcription regulator sge1 n=1 Tax=Diaporthe australafricana TaxID=127596 RepID=A0ABR3Y4V8_9PEZI